MPPLDHPILGAFIDVLAPHVKDEPARRDLLHEALGTDYPPLRHVIWSGSAENFLSQLAPLLQDEEAYPGRNALVAIMTTARRQVSADDLQQFDHVRDTLIEQLEPADRPDFSTPNHVFVSHSSQDNVFVTKLAASLEGVVADVWIDVERLEVGHHWRSEIFTALEKAESVLICLTIAAVNSPWVRREISSALLLKKRVYPLMLEDCAAVMQQYEETQQLLEYQFIDFVQYAATEAYNQAINALIAELSDPTKYAQRCPFKGLEAFQETDAPFFFGRQERIEKLVERLKASSDTRFLAVVGASGSGKSSLVRAGLLPVIRQGDALDSHRWVRILITPGDNPLRQLAEALHREFGQNTLPVLDVFNRLVEDVNGLNTLADDLLPKSGAGPPARLLVVIDQFEEVFTRTEDDTQRIRFFERLHAAATGPANRCQIIVTMRADFLDRLSSYPDMARLFEGENLFFATELKPHELLETITGPGDKVGLIFEAGLPNRIVQDVLQEPGALPLMQYALKLLYERRQGRHITSALYEQVGGVQQALATHAEEVFTLRLKPAEQDMARRLFLDLITVDPESGTASRRPRPMPELVAGDLTPDIVQPVVDVLASAENRLLTTHQHIATVPGQSESTQQITWVQISHEALARRWPRYVTWIQENRRALQLRDEFEVAAQNWHTNRRDPAFLLVGIRLESAREWLNAPFAQGFISTLQREFVEASIAHFEAEQAREREQYEHQLALERENLDQQKRATRRVWQFLSVTAGLLAVAIALAVIAWQLRQESERRRIAALENESRALASLALQELVSDPVASLNHSLEALYTEEGTPLPYVPQAEYALTQAYQASLERGYLPGGVALADHVAVGDHQIAVGGDGLRLVTPALDENETLVLPGEPRINGVAWSPDASTLLSYDAQHATVWRDPPLNSPPLSNVTHAVWNPRGNPIAVGAEGGVWIWEPDGTFEQVLEFTGTLRAIRWSPDGEKLVAWNIIGSQRSTVKFWDTATETARDYEFMIDVKDVAWSPESDSLLVASGPDAHHIMLESDADPVVLQGHSDLVTGVTFQRNGMPMSWGFDGTVRVWDSSGDAVMVYAATDRDAHISGVIASPDSMQWLAYTDRQTATIWDAATGAPRVTLRGHTASIITAEWHGDYILTAGRDKTARVWDAQTGKELITLYGHTDGLLGAHWLSDRRVLTYSQDGSLRVWDVLDESGAPLCQGRDTDQRQICQAHRTALQLPEAYIFQAGWLDANTVVAVDTSPSIWHLTAETQTPTVTDITINPNDDILFSPDYRYVFVFNAEDGGRLWDVARAELITTLAQAPEEAVWTGEHLLVSANNGTVALYEPATGAEVVRLNDTGGPIRLARLSPDKQRIVGGNPIDETLHIWDAEDGTLMSDAFADTGYADFAWSPDGQHLATVNGNGVFRLWDGDTEMWNAPVAENIGTGAQIAFHPTADFVAAAINGNTYVWAYGKAEPEWEIEEYNSAGLQWDADGTRLLVWGTGPVPGVSGDISGYVTVWDWKTRTKVLEVSDKARLMHAALNATGTHVMMSSASGTVIVWPTGKPLAELSDEVRACCITR